MYIFGNFTFLLRVHFLDHDIMILNYRLGIILYSKNKELVSGDLRMA